MNVETFNQGPKVYIPILIFNLLITIFAYGLFPFILAKARKTAISKKKYNRLCYAVNFVIAALFFLMSEDGGAMNLAPYVLWTAVFSYLGRNTLEKKELLFDDEQDKTKSSTQRDEIRFCRKCGEKLRPSSIACHKCGTEIKWED